jgi:hypothetical protein
VLEQWEPEAKIDYTDGDAATNYTEDGQEIEYITFEEIDAMMELESFENNVAGRERGLRNLHDITCWHGGQSNRRLWCGVSEYSKYSRWIVLNIVRIACAHHIQCS